MQLLLKSQKIQLHANDAATAYALEYDVEQPDHKPVVKFFNPNGAATWLITEMDEDGRMFGLCDLGFGTPELGYVMFQELAEFRGRFGLGIERDMHFKASKTISEYAQEAHDSGRIAA